MWHSFQVRCWLSLVWTSCTSGSCVNPSLLLHVLEDRLSWKTPLGGSNYVHKVASGHLASRNGTISGRMVGNTDSSDVIKGRHLLLRTSHGSSIRRFCENLICDLKISVSFRTSCTLPQWQFSGSWSSVFLCRWWPCQKLYTVIRFCAFSIIANCEHKI